VKNAEKRFWEITFLTRSLYVEDELVLHVHRTKVLLKYLKVLLDIVMKIIFLDYQNNYVERISTMNNAKNFYILIISLNVLIILSNKIIFRSVSS